MGRLISCLANWLDPNPDGAMAIELALWAALVVALIAFLIWL